MSSREDFFKALKLSRRIHKALHRVMEECKCTRHESDELSECHDHLAEASSWIVRECNRRQQVCFREQEPQLPKTVE